MVMPLPLGELVITPGALELVHPSVALDLLRRHRNHDWGDLCEEDRSCNEQALKDDARIMSAYKVDDRKVWIITEADRSATTILLPEEY